METKPKCTNHEKDADFYCRTPNCMYGYCVSCGMNHLGHDYLKIDDPSLPNILSCDISVFLLNQQKLYDQSYKEHEAIELNLRQIQNEVSQVILDIEGYFVDLVEALKAREIELIREASTKGMIIEAEIREDLEECEKVMKSQKDIIDSITALKDSFEVMDFTEKVEKTYDLYNKYAVPSSYKQERVYIFNAGFDCDPFFKEEFQCIGRVHTQQDELNGYKQTCFNFFKEFAKDIYKYDITHQAWEINSTISIPRLHHFNVVYAKDRDEYIIVGCTANQSKLIKYHASQDKIEQFDLGFEYPQWSFSCYYWGKLFLLGGEINDSSTQECKAYTPRTNTWSDIAELIIARDSSSVIGFENKYLYVFGGYSNNISLKSIERYHKDASRWELLHIQMPMPLAFISIVSTGIELVLFGGECNERSSDQVFKWNGYNGFKECPRLSAPFTCGGSDIVVFISGNVYIIRAEDSDFPTAEIYPISNIKFNETDTI